MATKGNVVGKAINDSLRMWNQDTNQQWTIGTNWNNTGTQFETYINKYLFPKLNETIVSTMNLGNRFDSFAQETEFVGQFTEEYVIEDMLPVDMNLSKSEDLMLKRNYTKMRTKLFAEGALKKVKFTINDNDNRLNWSTLGQATKYALDVYRKAVSSINIDEEQSIKSMIVDYMENFIDQDKQVRTATSVEDLAFKLGVAVLNMQNNSANYNESRMASGGSIGKYSTYTKLSDVFILTTDEVKAYLVDTKLANTFQVAGIDLLDHVISFDDLGGAYKTTADITLTAEDVAGMKTYGDYQAQVGDIVPSGDVLTYDISELPSFVDNVVEVKPVEDYVAYVLDVKAVRYKRNTKNMVESFYNPEFREYNYWLHYYTFKGMSPFFNKIKISVK